MVELDKIIKHFGEVSVLMLNRKKKVLGCINQKWENLPGLKSKVQEKGCSLGAVVLPLLGLYISLEGIE